MREKNKQAVSVTLEGDLTIQNVSDLKQKFLHELNKSPVLKVEWGEVGNVDIAGVQLLHSLVKTAETQEKTLELSRPFPTILQQLIKESGFGYLSWAMD